MWLLWAVGCVSLALHASATFVQEQGGLKVGTCSPQVNFLSPMQLIFDRALQITFPPDAKSKYPGGFDMALANFGSPKYGGALM